MSMPRRPLSHTSYSWGGSDNSGSGKKRVPLGHTDFSWGVGTREKLRRLGYGFDASDEFGGRLRQLGPYGGLRRDAGFAWAGQAHYDALAEAVLEHAEWTLVSVAGLVRVELLPGCPVYHSADFFTNRGVLLLLIQGTGRVRVGVWGCALCINDSMRHGSMVEYVLRARERGYSVLVLNPNCRTAAHGSRSKEEHCLTAWDRFVGDDPALDPPSPSPSPSPSSSSSSSSSSSAAGDVGGKSGKSPAQRICVVGHSYGGVCSVELLKRRQGSFAKRVAALALTDSAHSVAGSLAELGTPETRSASLASRFTGLFSRGTSKSPAGDNANDHDDDDDDDSDPFATLDGAVGSPERRRHIARVARRAAAARAFLASEKVVNWVAVQPQRGEGGGGGRGGGGGGGIPELDAPIAGPAASGTGCRHLSGGTKDHASTNFASVDSVFAFFEHRLASPPRPYGPTAWS